MYLCVSQEGGSCAVAVSGGSDQHIVPGYAGVTRHDTTTQSTGRCHAEVWKSHSARLIDRGPSPDVGRSIDISWGAQGLLAGARGLARQLGAGGGSGALEGPSPPVGARECACVVQKRLIKGRWPVPPNFGGDHRSWAGHLWVLAGCAEIAGQASGHSHPLFAMPLAGHHKHTP